MFHRIEQGFYLWNPNVTVCSRLNEGSRSRVMAITITFSCFTRWSHLSTMCVPYEPPIYCVQNSSYLLWVKRMNEPWDYCPIITLAHTFCYCCWILVVRFVFKNPVDPYFERTMRIATTREGDTHSRERPNHHGRIHPVHNHRHRIQQPFGNHWILPNPPHSHQQCLPHPHRLPKFITMNWKFPFPVFDLKNGTISVLPCATKRWVWDMIEPVGNSWVWTI